MNRLFRCFALRWIAYGRRRMPDFVIGGKDAPYLKRWWLVPRNRWFNVYLHRFTRSDDDRALHDHPWAWCSILLHGRYVEITRRCDGSGVIVQIGGKFTVERWSGATPPCNCASKHLA